MTPYLDIQHLTKSIGDLVLFEDISFSVAEGQHVGLIARNGAGKSTLLSIISGKDSADDGQIVFMKGLRIGLLEQQPVFDPQQTVIQAVTSRLKSDYASLLISEYGSQLAAHTAALDADEEWKEVEMRAKQILTKLKITNQEKPVGLLSGGQQKRVALASVLIANPDLLILDEPTNHLDLEMIEWLEQYLQRHTKALLLVTHDRYFLDRVCGSIIELDDRTCYTYRGNYAYYLEKREERIAVANANIDRARNLYRKELDWMRRMPQARGHKSRSRKEAFYELEKLARARTEERRARLDIRSGYIGGKIFEAQYVSKSFDDGIVILRDFYYNFSRYEKMGIVGNNGTGKSTFIRMLLGQEPTSSGRFVVGETVRFGYFSQEGMPIDTQMKVIDVVRRVAETIDLGGGRRLTAMQFLQHFLFPPARQQDYVYKLSGGEKRRLQLCLVLMQNPNFLILDEPTNDLDIPTLQILEEYLYDFRGCVIVVSHDRYFMDKVVDHLLVFKGDGVVDDFPGNYTQYRDFCSIKEKETTETQRKSQPAEARRKPVHEGSDRRRRLTYAERREYEALEADIERLETEKADIEAQLCSGTLSVERITELSKRLPELSAELDEKSMRWLELSEWA
ncbi:MAG: ABC-F family ATP-binding cassette domain-containing protein [Alloprevotella sp.]